MSSKIARQASAVCAAALFLVYPSLWSQAFTFGPTHKVPLTSGSYTYSVTPLDMNGDGNTDLYVSTVDGNFIYLGNGKGSFSSTPVKAVESAGSFHASPGFYDVNGDGFADEVFGYSGYTDPSGVDSYPGVFAVLLGNGKGQFTEATYLYLAGDEGVSSLIAGDFNHDGKLDFALVYAGVAGDQYGSALTIFMNTGDGKFQASSLINLTGYPGGLTAGDFNGDGKLDLAWIDQDLLPGTENQFAIHCLLGNGDGTFGPDTICYRLDGRPYSIASADFNRDGKADLIVSTDVKLNSSGKPVPGARPRMATLLSRGAQGGRSFFWWSSASWDAIGTSLQITDLNGDGKPDVVGDDTYLFENRGNGVFSSPQIFATKAANTFVPVVRDGLPAVFYIDPITDADIDYRLNTSPK